MDIEAAQNHIWRNHGLVEGDKYPAEPSEEEKERLVRIGLARETSGYPEDFPANLDIPFDEVKALYEADDLQSIEGVAEKTEQKIKEYFDGS